MHPTTDKDRPMFIAMNRFRIAAGRDAEFIDGRRQRDSDLGPPQREQFDAVLPP